MKALKTAKVLGRFEALSYSHQREHVEAIEGGKKPETRQRRIAGAVKVLLG
ncbi:MAG TPA: YdeI/OmpD-associated family protein [Polyangiaceae bacterium]|nr:YdeI/OmpD-associated family protein [Polyangiaceae bacterium]